MKNLVKIFPFVAVFLLSLYNPVDADLGWHLKYGEYFVQHGQILRENQFSSALPDYQWVNISWAIDVVDYLIYNYFGFFGLTVLSAAIITLCFYIYDKTFSPPYWLKLIYPLSIWVGYHIFAYSFRGQVLSLLFLGLTVCQLTNYARKPNKNIYLLVPLFVLWANTHGQFIVGLGVIFVWTVWQSLKRFDLNLIFLLLLCIVATLIHPYGYHIYRERVYRFSTNLILN